jgi:hypothetical protein
MHVETLGWQDQHLWDNFIDLSFNGTIFHKMKFLSYHPKARFDYTFVGIFRGKVLLGVLPCVIDGPSLKSPVGASFGGIVLPKISFVEMHKVVSIFLRWAGERGISNINFVLAPLIYNDKLAQDLEFVLQYCGFRNIRNLFSSVVDLSFFDRDENMEHISSSGRRAIRKSVSAGVTFSVSKDFSSYYSILERNKAKFGVKPAHTESEMVRLNNIFPDEVNLFAVFHNKKMLGGVYVVRCNPRTLLAFYIASLPEFQDIRPVNRVLFELAKWARQNGYSYLDLGVSMNTASDNPMEPAWSLVSFKEFIGSRGFLRPYYEWNKDSSLRLE